VNRFLNISRHTFGLEWTPTLVCWEKPILSRCTDRREI
jgi:hypothetical protein